MSRQLLCLIYLVFLIFQITLSVVIKVENLPETCDFTKCTKPDPKLLNVHLVPHTHDDVGWLKTVDQYYYGTRAKITKAGVQFIIDTVIEELIRNKQRRFIYVETAFFWKWWKEQDQETKDIVKELVRSGQLEFINGGWSMPDEASTHYNSLIDQSTWGLRRLNDTFGKCGIPKVTWQIDPFGHSRELASLYAQMNYDAMYFAREDYEDNSKRAQHRTLEHVWQGSDDLGKYGDLFTGMMHNGYGPLADNWDLIGGNDEPIVDNIGSEEYNVPNIVNHFRTFAKRFSTSYATNHVMFPMGTDFQYQAAHSWFKNLDKLITAVNKANVGIKIFYSTPSCYTKALNDLKLNWTSKVDDFFPYASDPHAYWTGYFTSRPALKRMERLGNNWLQACKQLDVLAGNGGKFDENITKLREAMGVMQHHDAVAGTEKQHVSNDYAKKLAEAIQDCQNVISKSLKQIISNKKMITKTNKLNLIKPLEGQSMVFCNYSNISQCEITETSSNVAMIVYNPLGHNLINRIVRLPVKDNIYYRVIDPANKSIPSSLISIPNYVKNIPGRTSSASMELVFRINVKALGLATYQILTSKTKTPDSAVKVEGKKIMDETVVKAKTFDIVFDNKGQLSNIVYSGEKIKFENNWNYYKGFSGNNWVFSNRSSGAYIFRPLKSETYKAGNLVESTLFNDSSNNLIEVHQKFDSFIEQIIKVDTNANHIEFEFVVGPIPVNDGVGKEIITRYDTDLNNENTFYTDANGRQLLKRVLNYRPTWKLVVEEPVAGNYYPVNSRIFLKDLKKKLQLTVLNDRSQGGSSLQNGTIELMVHRRLLHDDGFGVDEALNEISYGKGLVIRGRHFVILSKIDEAAIKHRPLAQQLFMEPIISFEKISDKEPSINSTRELKLLSEELPENVHLLTLEQWNNNKYLLRLEHFYQNDEDKQMSKPVKINLKNLFNQFDIVDAQELTLAANQDISELKNRMVFDFVPSKNVARHEPNQDLLDNKTLEVTLNPMQIRTFLIQAKWR